MRLIRFFRRLGLKSVLRSALVMEEEIYNLYAGLKEELAGLEIPPSIARIIDEEVGHQRLLRDMIGKGLQPAQLDGILEGKPLHIHHPEEIKPLPARRYAPVLGRIENILHREEEVHNLFANLYRKAKIPFARRAFGFLQEQEQTHVLLLKRLLGKSAT